MKTVDGVIAPLARNPWLTLALLAALLPWRGVSASEVPRVVVSSKPLHSLFAQLMQGVAEPQLLIDGETAPWRFAPDRAQEEAIRNADLVVWTGPELEPGLAAPISRRAAPGGVFEVLGSDRLKVLPVRDDEGLRDPFYWLDTRNMLILLDRFGERLVALDPDRRSAYERNWQLAAASLSEIDRALEFGYRDVSGVPVFFYHDTHRYFAQAYAMHVAGAVVHLAGGEQADTASLLQVRSAMLSAGPSCLFIETGLEEPHLDLLREDTDATVVELDSFGIHLPAGADLYVELMRRNFAALSQCIRRQRPAYSHSAVFAGPDLARSPGRYQPRYLLMDQYGRSVSNEDFPNRLQLIYFGYTFCPDVCPTSLTVMTQALKILGDQAEQVQPIFITIDPLRDTPGVLGRYVAYFDPRMLGLSGSPEATQRVAELFRARYERVASDSGDPDRYTMDHTASLFVLGRQGEFVTKFAHGLPATEVAARLRELLED